MNTVDQWIARANIEHFRQRLAAETDEAKRRTIARLLVEEQAKLQAAMARDQEQTKQA